ncbi:hypothetical protein [Ramlibacter pinisoli]|uniref:Uncharacterized protein n=2 Tax=Ramlibacter TaxID=174951 RepID=A0A6N8IMC1_9BURK|nr:hypothetical protein [Ramlibacter pinisoli]MVQ27842.1 hypothetical protein [Ramlibacter pinisoli]
MSSGITKIELAEGEYRIHNESGSVYSCRSGAEGMSGFASSVLRRYQDDVAALGVTIRQLEKIESGPLPIHTALMKQLGDFVEVVQVASSERLPPDEEDSRGLRL